MIPEPYQKPVGKLAAVYQQTDEFQIMLIASILAEYPVEQAEFFVDEIIRSERFWPRPAQITELAASFAGGPRPLATVPAARSRVLADLGVGGRTALSAPTATKVGNTLDEARRARNDRRKSSEEDGEDGKA